MLRPSYWMYVFLFIWMLGLILFAIWVKHLARPAGEPLPHLDAIVVLTGDKGRIEKGMMLFQKKLGDQLFISGVGAEKQRVTSISTPKPHLTLGYEAKNTVGNAKEVRDWVLKQGIQSFYLVTSDYHMVRSLFELQNQMPTVTIKPYPVATSKRDHKVFVEYHKVIFAFLRLKTENILRNML